MIAAQTITAELQAKGLTREGDDAIFAVIAEDGYIACLTESHLDLWWQGLSPEEKGALYEAFHESSDGPLALEVGND